MDIKERIIRSKLERLDPAADAALIKRLNAELESSPCTAAPKEPPLKKTEAAHEPARSFPLTDADVDDFRSLDTEVPIRSVAFSDIWLVPERTGADRFELLPEEVLALDHARKIFGARIIEVTKNVPL